MRVWELVLLLVLFSLLYWGLQLLTYTPKGYVMPWLQ